MMPLARRAVIGSFVLSAVSCGGDPETGVTRPPVAREPLVVHSVTPLEGPTNGGILVTIRGTGFQAGTYVLFGNAGATVLTAHATQITVVAPAGAVGNADIFVGLPEGGRVRAPMAFHYVAATPGDPCAGCWDP